jgi:hypothetical protein
MSPSGGQPRSRLLTDAALEAVQVALEALEERASTTRLLLEDPTLHGLVSADTAHRNLERDSAAAALLHEALSTPRG